MSLRGAQPPGADYPVVRFTVFSPRPAPGVGLVQPENVAPLPVEFYPTARSPDYEYRGPMPLRFVDLRTGETVAETNVPPDLPKTLLLFIPVRPGPAPGRGNYRILVLDDRAPVHGSRGLAVVNLSGLPLTGTVGNRRIAVVDGLNPPIPVGSSASVAFETIFRNRRYRSFGDIVLLAPGERALLLLFPPFYRGSLEVQGRMLVDEAGPNLHTGPP